eukprot:scaffold122183_cov39-Phaeocystis_antarctica.AAC.1
MVLLLPRHHRLLAAACRHPQPEPLPALRLRRAGRGRGRDHHRPTDAGGRSTPQGAAVEGLLGRAAGKCTCTRTHHTHAHAHACAISLQSKMQEAMDKIAKKVYEEQM